MEKKALKLDGANLYSATEETIMRVRNTPVYIANLAALALGQSGGSVIKPGIRS